MTWKKFFTKSFELLELIVELGSSSEEERKRDAMRSVEATYDAAYYSGQMSQFSADACKDAFRYSIGLEKKY